MGALEITVKRNFIYTLTGKRPPSSVKWFTQLFYLQTIYTLHSLLTRLTLSTHSLQSLAVTTHPSRQYHCSSTTSRTDATKLSSDHPSRPFPPLNGEVSLSFLLTQPHHHAPLLHVSDPPPPSPPLLSSKLPSSMSSDPHPATHLPT